MKIDRIPEVFVIGAGLSKAVSEEMPLIGEVHRFLEESLREEITPGVEEWMSLLSAPQPYLSTDENRSNAAKFIRVARLVAQFISTQQELAVAGRPGWFFDLLRIWSYWNARVVTFNYDTLIEDSTEHDVLLVGDQTFDAVAANFTGDGSGAPQIVLDKLHGSIGESWDPDLPASVLGPAPPVGPPFAPRSMWPRWAAFERFEPFIVPPVTTKSSFYEVPAIRTRWTIARHAIEAARTVAVVGYSFPTADFVSSSLVARGIRGPEGLALEKCVHIVDLQADDVLRRMRESSGDVPAVTFKGPDAISNYVSSLSEASLSFTIERAMRERFPHMSPSLRVEGPVEVHRAGRSDTERLDEFEPIQTVGELEKFVSRVDVSELATKCFSFDVVQSGENMAWVTLLRRD